MGEWDPFRRLPVLASGQALVELLLDRGDARVVRLYGDRAWRYVAGHA